jgi:lipopolysaccharide/colanic/teichoic acid biosynthesis glycosyltransferase
VSGGVSGARELVAVEPFVAAPSQEADRERTLVERYRQMAHEFRPGPVDRALRMLDVVGGAASLVVLLPLLLTCALVVLVTSGRPLLYRGSRVGRNGHLFVMYKLRTLRADAHTRLEPFLGLELTQLTSAEMTRVGRLLRATKVDELPQLWNVVRGDMSLVGPRPIRPGFFEVLCETTPAYWQRLVVRPGISGLAQLRLSREMTWEEKLAHDFEYIADRSPRLYVAVLAQTGAMLMGRLLGRET